MSVCAKVEGCAAKTVRGVGFLGVMSISKKALLPNFASRLPVWWYRLQTSQTFLKMIYDATLEVW